MSEIALVSARKTKLETEAKKGNRGARKALDLAEEPGAAAGTGGGTLRDRAELCRGDRQRDRFYV